MKYLHTMIRISNIEESLKFFCDGLGLKETRRMKNEQCRIKCDQTDYISARQKDGNGVYLVLK